MFKIHNTMLQTLMNVVHYVGILPFECTYITRDLIYQMHVASRINYNDTYIQYCKTLSFRDMQFLRNSNFGAIRNTC